MRRRLKVGLRCDAGPTTGVGHLMRCIAFAEELEDRGIEAVFLGDLGGLTWAEHQISRRGFTLIDAPASLSELVRCVSIMSLSAVVLDSYDLPAETGLVLGRTGLATIFIHDGDTNGQVADIYIDQNLGAEDRDAQIPEGARSLNGLDYVLLRDDVRRCRPQKPPMVGHAPLPKVLCFFGGTDPSCAALSIGALLSETARPFDATFVAATASIAADLQRLVLHRDQRVEIIPLTDQLPELIVKADLVVSAAGTSTWELFCLGAPAALVWVAENQRISYERVISAGLAEGLGNIRTITNRSRSQAIEKLSWLLREPRRRSELARQAWLTIDGKGRKRVVDRMLDLLHSRAMAPHTSQAKPTSETG